MKSDPMEINIFATDFNLFHRHSVSFSDTNNSGSYFEATAEGILVCCLMKQARQKGLCMHTGICVCEKRNTDLPVCLWSLQELEFSHEHLQISLSSPVLKMEM